MRELCNRTLNAHNSELHDFFIAQCIAANIIESAKDTTFAIETCSGPDISSYPSYREHHPVFGGIAGANDPNNASARGKLDVRVLTKHFGDKLIRLQLDFWIKLYDDPLTDEFSVAINGYAPSSGEKGLFYNEYKKTFSFESISEELISGFFKSLKSEKTKLISVLSQTYVAEKRK
jgi:hypothetical protein